MQINSNVILNLYFVMIRPWQRKELGSLLGYLWLRKKIGNIPQCTDCQAKGVVLCTTCAGTGPHVDSILESQGSIVKVRCPGIYSFLLIRPYHQICVCLSAEAPVLCLYFICIFCIFYLTLCCHMS